MFLPYKSSKEDNDVSAHDTDSQGLHLLDELGCEDRTDSAPDKAASTSQARYATPLTNFGVSDTGTTILLAS